MMEKRGSREWHTDIAGSGIWSRLGPKNALVNEKDLRKSQLKRLVIW
jgi:hypothetical protein